MMAERDKILALEKLAAITPLHSGMPSINLAATKLRATKPTLQGRRLSISLIAPKLRGTKPNLQGGIPDIAFQKTKNKEIQ